MRRFICSKSHLYKIRVGHCDQPVFVLFMVLLLKPRCEVVACPEVIEQKTNPACCQYNNRCEQLSDQTDRLLENVNNAPNRANNTY